MRKNLLWIPLMITIILSLFSVNMIGITVAQADHDVAVASVTPSPTSVRLGEPVNITVVVENKGTNNETFDIAVYYNLTTTEWKAIGTQNVTNLAPFDEDTITFTWNTTNTREEIYATTRKEKTYAINATATLALDEYPNDNTLVSPGKVRVVSKYIAVIPQSTVDPTLTPGKNFTVSIYTDYNGTDIWSWQFCLSYNPDILEGIEIVNGDLITTDKHPDADFVAGAFNNTLGKLDLTSALFFYTEPPIPTTSGPGTFAYVTFRVKGMGDSNITLVAYETSLRNPKTGLQGFIINNFLPHFEHLMNGYFRNTEEEVIHDIAVVSVTPSPTSVRLGEPVNITVVVENKGTVTETFDVKVYYEYKPGYPGTNLVGTQTVTSLEKGTSTTLTFTWNTTNVVANDYTITAFAVELSGETETENNRLDSVEMVTIRKRETRSMPIELIAGSTVAAVAIVVVVYAVMRRKKSTPA